MHQTVLTLKLIILTLVFSLFKKKKLQYSQKYLVFFTKKKKKSPVPIYFEKIFYEKLKKLSNQ